MNTLKEQKRDEIIKTIIPELRKAVEKIVKENDTKLTNQIYQDLLKTENLQEMIWILEALEENI
jgi:acetyl-CoA carboxylase alpha subunit